MPEGSQEREAASSPTSEKRPNAERAPKRMGRPAKAKARTETTAAKGVLKRLGGARVGNAKSETVGRSQAVANVPGRVPTDRQRYLAAEIRVEADKKLKRETPEWIVELAVEGNRKFAS